MLALRNTLTRSLAARTPTPQVYSFFATGSRQYDGTFYEFRTYYLKPSKMNEFLENVKKNIHLRTAHSELVGYWSVEFGGRMNKVFHIWKYDNFTHRAEVRKALAKDKEWQEQFLIPNLPLIDEQESEITYLVPWCKLEKPQKEGVYELATFQMKPGGPALWGDSFKRAVRIHVSRGYTKLVGVFHAEYGLLNRVHVLWWNESAESRAAGRHQSHEDPRVVAAEWLKHFQKSQELVHPIHSPDGTYKAAADRCPYHVPDKSGEPEDNELHSADELQVLCLADPLLDQEHNKAGWN